MTASPLLKEDFSAERPTDWRDFMIDLSQSLIFELLLKAFLLGAALGLFYDVIRFIKMLCGVEYFVSAECRERTTVRKTVIFAVTFLTDLIFWLIFGISSIILLYNICGGVFRASIYPCMLFGFLLYYFSLGRLFLIIGSKTVLLLKRICRWIIRLILIPIRLVGRFFIFIYHLTIGKIVGKIKERINLSREKKKKSAEDEPTELDVGEEERKYGDEGYRYRKEGRIYFGNFRGSA